MIEYARLRSALTHTSKRRHSPLHPQHWWESAFSLPCLSFVPPSLPPFLLPASLQPSPLPLPQSSIVSAWFSSLSCSMQPCLAFTEQPEPNAAQRPIWAQGRRKGSTSNCRASQENKAALTPELIHRLGESECVLTHIDLFPQSWNTLIISVSALVCRLTRIPWFILGEQQTCYLKKKLTLQFSDKLPGSNMHSFLFIWFTTFLTHSVEEEGWDCNKQRNKLLKPYLWHIGRWYHLIPN